MAEHGSRGLPRWLFEERSAFPADGDAEGGRQLVLSVVSAHRPVQCATPGGELPRVGICCHIRMNTVNDAFRENDQC